jgi:hypothetical protein
MVSASRPICGTIRSKSQIQFPVIGACGVRGDRRPPRRAYSRSFAADMWSPPRTVLSEMAAAHNVLLVSACRRRGVAARSYGCISPLRCDIRTGQTPSGCLGNLHPL